ncbi:hypothetical protein [Planobispora takensis]|uniref:Uncharacterized protein n=1 Tax=Planobispora takensis TaxID=1367882 RepID=A0A8J3WZQ6_9ACTN|nr:hypothetical protein [Planobispora takensis]GII05017.1 hypothetical protein Pta02_70250 [Planobispora takensis]
MAFVLFTLAAGGFGWLASPIIPDPDYTGDIGFTIESDAKPRSLKITVSMGAAWVNLRVVLDFPVPTAYCVPVTVVLRGDARLDDIGTPYPWSTLIDRVEERGDDQYIIGSVCSNVGYVMDFGGRPHKRAVRSNYQVTVVEGPAVHWGRYLPGTEGSVEWMFLELADARPSAYKVETASVGFVPSELVWRSSEQRDTPRPFATLTDIAGDEWGDRLFFIAGIVGGLAVSILISAVDRRADAPATGGQA